jgi:SAM-dependent methyltransferase
VALCYSSKLVTNDLTGPGLAHFYSAHYKAHNDARLTHLASLGLPLDGRKVLEVGCGPGDHTGFYLERGCTISSVDARPECVEALRARYPCVGTAVVDMNAPNALNGLGKFEVVHCYGLLYHLEDPQTGIATMASVTSDMLLLESCVSARRSEEVYPARELARDFTQSIRGLGCRPTRQWLFKTLGRFFAFVYQTRTQPDHPEFPLDWAMASDEHGLIRVVLVASRTVLEHPLLSPSLLEHQDRFA